ncbi:putative oxidoreductase, aryl-alcohol dehydrogenase like protein [Frankia casuarinae]|nr:MULTISPECIES: aldo/keto reductase [Frankia]ETA00831.1 putative oxidoreductase, aryl-alcohol dehydrogenase like protein [Frankia sp. CcI6]EYT91221.1 putative oxidoreductase, aryl-alcohol dehydrogenase like protein [Frankia casuarinae]OAA21473.1 putative oxidoreductase, aryl-alcohol dehydrogenase like protein [Frankia casuarinae]OHV51945.1 aldo/keto reductase [Frankia sp. CgIS1]
MTEERFPAPRALAGGLTVHPIGVGCWAIGGPDHNLGLPMGWSTADDHASRAGLELAYTLGANLFDTADVYGHGHSERLLGHLVEQVDRDSLVLSSKVGYFAGTAAHAYLPAAMRRQLETSLENLRTDRLDIYFFHTSEFGPDDRYLDGAVAQMREFQRQGLVRCVGMRGPHRYAPDRLIQPRSDRPDKHARFRVLFERIRPDFLAVRHNPLTPPPPAGQPDIFTLAADHHISILINKPLGQGLLTGKHDPRRPPQFGAGDHRQRKRWYTPDALALVERHLAPLRDRFGPSTRDLVRVALAYSLQRADSAAVLVGFTTPDQVRENLTALDTPLSGDDLSFVRATLGQLQQDLDAAGEVFLDETALPE